MYCTFALTIASLKMFLRNRQALFFSLFMPLMILCIFGSMDFDKPPKMNIGLITHHPNLPTQEFLKHIREVQALGITEGTLDAELAELNSGNRTAVLDVPDDLVSLTVSATPKQLKVYVNESRPIEAQMAMSVLNQMADRVSMTLAATPQIITLERTPISARHVRYVEFLLPGIIAMSIMQMSVFSVAFVFARYREQGILKRLMATPMRPGQFVTANILTRLCMALAQAFLFVLFGMLIFHIHVAGAYWLLALCVFLGALMFLGLGFTISGLAKTIETVPVYANLIVFPMLFLGNVFFPASGMPPWLRTLASFLPLSYFANALRAVMTDAAGPSAIADNLAGMLVWAVILVTLATITFRFHGNEGV